MPLLYNPLEVMRLRNDAGLHHKILEATMGKDLRTNSDGSPRDHQGWDLFAEVGTPAYAVADGIVVWTRNTSGVGYGRQLLLQFNKDGSPSSSANGTLYAFYAHLSETCVSDRDFVKGGQKVGLTGTSGVPASDKKYPHLHFEIRTTLSQTPGTGLTGRLDPSVVLGGRLLSCTPERIGGVDTVQIVCRSTGQATPVTRP